MKPIFRFFASNSMLSHLFVIIALIMGAHAYFGINRTLLPMISTGEVGFTPTYRVPALRTLNSISPTESKKSFKLYLMSRESSTSVEGSSILIKLEPHLKTLMKAWQPSEMRSAGSPTSSRSHPATKITEFKTPLMPIIEVAVVGEASYEDIRATAKQVQDILGDSFGVGHITPMATTQKKLKLPSNPKRSANTRSQWSR